MQVSSMRIFPDAACFDFENGVPNWACVCDSDGATSAPDVLRIYNIRSKLALYLLILR
jgi:hypothetical protein